MHELNNASSEYYAAPVLPFPAAVDKVGGMAKKPKIKHRIFIREWRKFRGLSQEQLAERMEMSQETVSRIERGTVNYTQPVLEAAAEALNCLPADLIMRDPGRPGSIFSIWEQIPVEKREIAAEMLTGLTRRTGTKG